MRHRKIFKGMDIGFRHRFMVYCPKNISSGGKFWYGFEFWHRFMVYYPKSISNEGLFFFVKITNRLNYSD